MLNSHQRRPALIPSLKRACLTACASLFYTDQHALSLLETLTLTRYLIRRSGRDGRTRSAWSAAAVPAFERKQKEWASDGRFSWTPIYMPRSLGGIGQLGRVVPRLQPSFCTAFHSFRSFHRQDAAQALCELAGLSRLRLSLVCHVSPGHQAPPSHSVLRLISNQNKTKDMDEEFTHMRREISMTTPRSTITSLSDLVREEARCRRALLWLASKCF